MKKYGLLALLLIGFFQLKAQQDPQFTQFMFNKLVYNPAYAGSNNAPCISAVYRNQWVGAEGAPVTQALSFHTAIKDRIGIGLSILHDKIGPSDSWTASLTYAYRIRTEKGVFSVGLQGTLYRYQVDFNNESTVQPNDILVQGAESSKIMGNVGGGLYYEQDNFYIGVSVPHIIRSDISLLTAPTSDVQARHEIHAYGMAGLMLPISPKVQLKPAVLVKYASNTPFDMDINASLLFSNRFLIGLTYRLGGKGNSGESVDLVAQFIASDAFRIGLAYDYSLSDFADHSAGSFEIMAQYCFVKKDQKVANPRFF